MIDNTICKQCSKSVLNNKNSICCDVCDVWFHLKCTNLTLHQFKSICATQNYVWYCKLCMFDIFPFSNMDNSNLFKFLHQQEINNLKTNIKHFIRNNNFSSSCSVCQKIILKKNSSIPCSSCKHLIHKKCSNTKTHYFKSIMEIQSWSCSICIQSIFPFSNLSDTELYKQLHSINDTKLDETKLNNLKEKLAFLSYSINNNPNSDDDENVTIPVNCDYYDPDEFYSLCKNNLQNSFSILHSNICSLQCNFNKLEILLESMPLKFDIISLTETWNPKSKSHMFEAGTLPGYQKFIGQTGTSLKSGCGLYISSHLNFIPRKDLDKHIHDENEFEAKWIEIINKNQPNTLVGTIYRHPSKTDINFINYLTTSLQKINKEQKLVMITGDFNINLVNYKKNKLTTEFLDLMFSNFYQPHILYPTRVVDNAKPSLLDNIFTNNIGHEPISGNLTNKISDHMPNFLILQKFQTSNKTKTQKKRFLKF